MNKKILDACCGSRMFWFDKFNENALFMDCRDESHILKDSTAKTGERIININPDIVGDFTDMKFPDESFSMVVFDPPHLINNGKSGWLAKKYGKLQSDWKEDISKGFSECFRVLKENGTLIFKWNETDIPVSEILALTTARPLFGNRCGKSSKSHWIVFMKGAI